MPAMQDTSLPCPGQPWWTQKTKPAQISRPVAARCSPDEFYQAQLEWRSSLLQQVLDKRQAAEDAADAAANARRPRAPTEGASLTAGPVSGARVAWSEDNAGKTRAAGGPDTPGGVDDVDSNVVEDLLSAGVLVVDTQDTFERLYDEDAARRERRDATHAEAERLRVERESAACTFAPRRAAAPPSSVSPLVAALAGRSPRRSPPCRKCRPGGATAGRPGRTAQDGPLLLRQPRRHRAQRRGHRQREQS